MAYLPRPFCRAGSCTALGVAHHPGGDRGAGLFGADDHAFHGAFLARGHFARQAAECDGVSAFTKAASAVPSKAVPSRIPTRSFARDMTNSPSVCFQPGIPFLSQKACLGHSTPLPPVQCLHGRAKQCGPPVEPAGRGSVIFRYAFLPQSFSRRYFLPPLFFTASSSQLEGQLQAELDVARPAGAEHRVA